MDSFRDYVYGGDMGRPPKATEDKRQQATLRFDPAVMTRLKAQAKANGRSVGKEIEARVASTLRFDAAGLELVSRIGAEIDALCRESGKCKRWSTDITGWGAVAELLAEGPIQEMRPINPLDREDQLEACKPLFKIDQQRLELVRQLGEIGIPADLEPKVRGLLRMSNRRLERATIDAIDDEESKATAIALHTELERLDGEYELKRQTFSEVSAPYYEAEDAGRQICRDYLYQEARRKRDDGERYNWSHLLRLYQSWR